MKKPTPEQQRRRNEIKETLGAIAIYLAVYGISVAMLIWIVKCSGPLPESFYEDYGYYGMNKNNKTPESATVAQNKLTGYNAARAIQYLSATRKSR